MSRTEFEHVLVVGGTGMLAEAAQHLAARASRLTMVARTERSLQRFGARLADHGLQTTLVAVDYNQLPTFLAAIKSEVERHGPPDLVLAWFHREAPALALAQQLAGRDEMPFFHVLGSARANPAADLAAMREPYDQLPHLHYHQIILGFFIEGCHSRWLTHHEISSGVIEAMAEPRPVHIVGTVEPWSTRP